MCACLHQPAGAPLPLSRGLASTWRAPGVVVLLFVCIGIAMSPGVLAGVVFSGELDGEIAELHAHMETTWARISNLTAQLRAAGAIPNVGLPATASPGTDLTVSTPLQVPAEKIQYVRKLETEYAQLQQSAFKIGRESADNSELRQHPSVHNYIQDLRQLKPKLEHLTTDLEKEYKRITGKQVDKPKKSKKSKAIRGISAEEFRSKARATLSQDTRPFRTKAMDIVSTFRERQLQMQDKQHDLRLVMDGPDWPKEDWPLSTMDAQLVGEGETMIQNSLQVLTGRLNQLGGLPRVHESDDESVLEQLVALSEMISHYSELIEQHVTSVKRVARSKKKQASAKTAASRSAGRSPSESSAGPPPLGASGFSGAPAPPTVGGPTLREQLLNFGAATSAQQPFAWLRDQGSSTGGAHGSMPTPVAPLAGGLGTFGKAPVPGGAGFGTFGGAFPSSSTRSAGLDARHIPPIGSQWTAAEPVDSGGIPLGGRASEL